MNTQQTRAIKSPCYFGFETMRQKFSRYKGNHTAILTLNAGYE